MKYPIPMRRAAALALIAIALPCQGQEAAKVVPPVADFGTCEKPVWPRESLRFEEQGTVTLAFLVDEGGTVQGSRIVESSGFPLLDTSARVGVGQCRFKPASQGGKPVAAWARMQYVWTLTPVRTADERASTYAAASAADKAALGAEAERGVPQARALLTGAAVRGNVAAKMWMAARYEGGKGVPRNVEAAAAWYRKAALAGDKGATQELARLYEQGLGVPEDKVAAQALRKAAAAAP